MHTIYIYLRYIYMYIYILRIYIYYNRYIYLAMLNIYSAFGLFPRPFCALMDRMIYKGAQIWCTFTRYIIGVTAVSTSQRRPNHWDPCTFGPHLDPHLDTYGPDNIQRVPKHTQNRPFLILPNHLLNTSRIGISDAQIRKSERLR